MESLSFSLPCRSPPSIPNHHPLKTPFLNSPTKSFSFSRPRATARPASQIVEDDVLLQVFLRERQANADFVSRISDMLWQKSEFVDFDTRQVTDDALQDVNDQVVAGSVEDGGFLKLSTTKEWVLGDSSMAPLNKKAIAKALQDDSNRRKKMNLLKYEALKRELMLLSVGIGSACTGYCLIVLSFQAAISYAIGVVFSCLYLQLLYQHADSLSKEVVPQIFMQKKSKKIGIRSEDLSIALERSIKGIGIALSSPRLVIPAAIYGLWVLSHQLALDFFDFQIVPAMFGMFAYKAAALVQVYRDNEDLQFIFPENEGGSRD